MRRREVGTRVLLTPFRAARHSGIRARSRAGALFTRFASQVDLHETRLDTLGGSPLIFCYSRRKFWLKRHGELELAAYITATAIVLLASTFLLAVFFLFLYRQKRQEYLVAWSAAWLLLSMHFVTGVLGATSDSRAMVPLARRGNELVLAMSALAFYCAARLYAGLTVPVVAMIVASVLAAAWPLAHAYQLFNVPPIVLGVGLIFMFVAHTFWQGAANRNLARTCCLPSPLSAGACCVFRARSETRWTFLQGVRSAAADDLAGAFRLRADGDGGLRRGAAARRAEHAGAFQPESGHVQLRRRRNSEDAGAGARPRPERGAHSGRRALLAAR